MSAREKMRKPSGLDHLPSRDRKKWEPIYHKYEKHVQALPPATDTLWSINSTHHQEIDKLIGRDDLLAIYLNLAANAPLLLKKEELFLGTFLLSRYKGDWRQRAAREIFFLANIRLVVDNAMHFLGFGIEILDLIQEGNVGLAKAVEKYDFSRGYRFATMATWWIKQMLHRAVENQSRDVRLPAGAHQFFKRMDNARDLFFQEYQREPTDEELAKELSAYASRVRSHRQGRKAHSRLDAKVSEADERLLLEVIPDNSPSVDEQVFEGQLRDAVRSALDELTPTEARLIILAFGLLDQETLEIKDIAAKYAEPSSTTRGKIKRALKKMSDDSTLKRILRGWKIPRP